MRTVLSATLVTLGAFSIAAQTPIGINSEGWQTLGGDWKLGGESASVTVAPGGTAAVALKAITLHDFEISYEFQSANAYAGLNFRTHLSPDFAKANGKGDLGAPGLYGDGVCYSAQKGLRLISSEGTGEHELSKTAVKDGKADTWHAVVLKAEGAKLSVSLDGAPAGEATDETFIGGGLAFCVAAADASGGGSATFRNLKLKDLGRTGNWRSLFNGKDESGWKEWGSEDWKVENGTIIGRSGPKKSEGYLATVERFEDFHVRAQFQMLGDGNFGLFFHSTITPKDDGYPVIAGIQGEVEPGYPSSTGWFYESYKRGWLVEPPKNTLAAFSLDPKGWNEIEIRSTGKRMTSWVNGVRAIDFDDPKPYLTEGSLALQLHTGGVDGIAWKELYLLEK